MKAFVREASDEALKLESALARLRTKKRIVVLHYAPVRAHVEGEPAEIIPLLGSSVTIQANPERNTRHVP